MTDFVPRTCTEVGEDDAGVGHSSLSFEKFRNIDAYVLLGAPGAGKTTAFKQEADCPKACYITARDFITFDDRPEWHDTTLFIDGLDEMRAGSSDGRTPLDSIRRKLDQLGRPRFRLSCREADWFGDNDRNHLNEVSRNGKVKVLRLAPLTEEDIDKILRDDPKVDDPEKFVHEARRQGLETLLTNPQSLQMLVDAVGGGTWPDTRKETYESACLTLAGEFNQEHKRATQRQVDTSVLLDAAGRLCAVQLLAGHAGYALIGDASNDEYPGLEQVPFDRENARQAAVRTKIFESPSEGLAAPVHRHIAEFLGGRYLGNLVQDGLPIRRILALMTGADGGVVSDLRGLSAWLATHSRTSRMEIIARDPIGTILYGDVRDFSVDEKRRLINDLNHESQRNPWFFDQLEKMDSGFGDLATHDMEPTFREALTSPTRHETHQALVVCLVEALRHGQVIPEFVEVVLAVVRDDSWWPCIRHCALDTILHQRKNDQQTDATLLALLADVNDGLVPDPDDELLGLLLSELYPSKLSASEILQYLRIPKNRKLGMYRYFWNSVARKSTNAQLTELLDILVERSDELLEKIRVNPRPSNPACRLPSSLLARFLNTSHENIAPDRLFDWLGVAALDFGPSDHLDPEVPKMMDGLASLQAVVKYYEQHGYEPPGNATHDIGVWLSNHPTIQKEIVAMCIKHCRGEQQFDLCVDMKHRRLFDATLPPDFGSWCIEQAIATDGNAATYYIHRAANALADNRHDERLTREIVEERLATHPSLKQAFRERLSERERQNTEDTCAKEACKKRESRTQQEFRDRVKEHVAALRENRCQPCLLAQLATAYFGEFFDIEGSNPKDRLCNLLGNDTDLIEMVLVGLRGTISRNDVPTDTEIIRLSAGNMRDVLELPFLAGLEELFEIEGEKPPLNERQMKQAVAFYYHSCPLRYYTRGESPHWYRRLLAHHPDMVSDVFIKFVRSEIRSGKKQFLEALNLASSKEHEAVARLASLSFLKIFPVRCTSPQLRLLNALLTAALLHCEKEAFVNLIEHKLALRSMNVAQRVYWLAAGLLASPASYRETLKTSVSGHERRIRHLAELLPAWTTLVFERLDVPELALLIRLTGDFCRPFSSSSDFHSSSDFVTGLIKRLASLPSPDATAALESLSSDNALHPWRSTFVNAAYRQNAIRREAGFRHKDIQTVLQTLDKRKPANAADLEALTTDMLSDMARRIRDGNTSDWRQYWNMHSSNKPETPKPKHEDLCRDALLSDLRLKLDPLGIDAQPEGRYADDKRADIRVTYGNFNVPVEIKKSNHRELWSAIREQLIRKYARDPGAGGYGIYLVLWFGEQDCQTPPEGAHPTSADKLQERLLHTLSADEKFKISTRVIDVSRR